MSTRRIVIVAVGAALSTVLGFLRLFEMPQGGSVTLDMVPIFYVAFWQGPWTGVATGALAGVVQFVLRPFAVHPVQVFLDYPLAMAACGLAGFFRARQGEAVTRRGFSFAVGLALVAAAGLQWLELVRVSNTSQITLARQDGVRAILTTRPDSALGDVEAAVVTVRTRQDGSLDTVGVQTAHGESARRWLAEGVATVRARQFREIRPPRDIGGGFLRRVRAGRGERVGLFGRV